MNTHSAWALDLVGQVLDASQPQNLNRASVTVADEGPSVGIILMPHQDLGGYSLVLWVDERHVILSWAGVTDLKRHDDIDLGRQVFRTDRSMPNGDEAVRGVVDVELRRPIHVTLRKTRIRRRWQLWCALDRLPRSETFVCDVATPPKAQAGRLLDEGTTSLMGPGRPAIRWAVPLADWHRWAEPAWRQVNGE
ncbi:MAG: hypothetical protein ACREMY_27365 [bacterium]